MVMGNLPSAGPVRRALCRLKCWLMGHVATVAGSAEEIRRYAARLGYWHCVRCHDWAAPSKFNGPPRVV